MNLEITSSVDRLLQALQRAPDVMMRHVDRTIEGIAIKGARQMKGDAPKNTSELTSSIRNQQIGLAFHEIIAAAPHAAYVHDGIGPGASPPLDILRAWIRTAQIRPREARNERDLAFLIQRKIRRDGIPARPFSEPTQTSTQERLRRMLPAAVDSGIREALA